MGKVNRGARGWLFGAGVMVALGFGGAQAAAAPSAGVGDGAPACNTNSCNRACQAQGAISGRCTDAGLCACLY